MGEPCRLTRRDAVRLLGLSALAAPAALSPRPAAAVRGWCKRDPVIRIDGKTARIWVSTKEDRLPDVTGPTEVVVTVPERAKTEFVWADNGFGYGYDLRFEESRRLKSGEQGTEVEVEVFVPARSDAVPIMVEFEAAAKRNVVARAKGRVNRSIRLDATF